MKKILNFKCFFLMFEYKLKKIVAVLLYLKFNVPNVSSDSNMLKSTSNTKYKKGLVKFV